MRSFRVFGPASLSFLTPACRSIIFTFKANSSPKFSANPGKAPLLSNCSLVNCPPNCWMALINIRKVKISSTLLVRSRRPSITSFSTPNFLAILPCRERFSRMTARILMIWQVQGEDLRVPLSMESMARRMFLVKGSLVLSLLRASSAMSDRRKMTCPWSWRLSSDMALKCRQQHFINRQCSTLLPKSLCSAWRVRTSLRGRSISQKSSSLPCQMAASMLSSVSPLVCGVDSC